MKIQAIPFELNEQEPVYIQIYKKIKKDIEDNYMQMEDTLPSIRSYANVLHVSRTSVENAYQKLWEEGYIISKPQKGYFVDVNKEMLNKRKALLEKEAIQVETYKYNFLSNATDPSTFDVLLWKKYLKQTLNDIPNLSTYGDSQGELILRKALSEYAYSNRSVLCNAKQIVVGTSFQSLLQTLNALIDESFEVYMEENGFLQAKQIFNDMHRNINFIKKQQYGINIKNIKNNSILYLNSTSCGTSKKQISLIERKEIVKNSSNFYIIEDDHNGELRYASNVLPSMQSFDLNEKVIYIGSFSKILLPSIRIAYMVLPEHLLKIYEERKSLYNPTTSKIEQITLANYIIDGNLEKHLRRLRRIYTLKCQKMESYIKQYFNYQYYDLEESSMTYKIVLNTTFDNNQIQRLCKENKLLINIENNNIIYLSFSGIELNDMEEGIILLKNILSE